MNGVFVTGTDTGVGKTFVTSTLLAWARHRGRPALPVKPVQTGWPAADDAAVALRAAGIAVAPKLRRLLTPFRYRLAASPHLAGNSRLTVTRLLRALQHPALRPFELIIEGAGGVCVPLNGRETMLDLVQRIGLPTLVVARAGLGTLNHTLLTVDALTRAGVPPGGVILNQMPGEPWGRIEQDNLRFLSRHLDCPVLRFRPVKLPMTGKPVARNFPCLENLRLASVMPRKNELRR